MRDNKSDIVLCIALFVLGGLVVHRVDVMHEEAKPPKIVEVTKVVRVPSESVAITVQPRAVAITCDAFTKSGQIDCVDGNSGENYGSFKVLNELPCQEDEVAAVKIDHDPTHGLTWECVNAEEYVNEYNNN